jgi:dienelactone hydrolase
VAELVLFHHALGLTDGVRRFADLVREAGHVVHTPNLYEGEMFTDIPSGVAHAEAIGFGAVIDRGSAAVAGLPHNLVYGGFSLGVLPAQKLAQTRPGARGALLYHGGVPTSTFDSPWPAGVPLQLHVMADDAWGDVDVVRSLGDEVNGAALFIYPGSAHLFADSSLPEYEPAAAVLLLQRRLEFLDRLG